MPELRCWILAAALALAACSTGGTVCDAKSCAAGCCDPDKGCIQWADMNVTTGQSTAVGDRCGKAGATCADCTNSADGKYCVQVTAGGACGCSTSADCPGEKVCSAAGSGKVCLATP